MPDTLGYRKRIGLVVPSTNTTVQPETDALRVPGVTCHTGRVTIKERPLNTEEAFYEHMQMMRDGMGTAIDQIMTAGLDHLIMGIALESFWGGVAAANKLQADLAQRAGVAAPLRPARSNPQFDAWARTIPYRTSKSEAAHANRRAPGGALVTPSVCM